MRANTFEVAPRDTPENRKIDLPTDHIPDQTAKLTRNWENSSINKYKCKCSHIINVLKENFPQNGLLLNLLNYLGWAPLPCENLFQLASLFSAWDHFSFWVKFCSIVKPSCILSRKSTGFTHATQLTWYLQWKVFLILFKKLFKLGSDSILVFCSEMCFHLN